MPPLKIKTPAGEPSANFKFRDAYLQIESGAVSDEGQAVRAKWPDGTPAHTYKTFAYETRYDLSREFPIMTLRKQSFKGAVKETLWIWQKKSNNIHDLGLRIWDAWADETGSIGKTYGYAAGEEFDFPEGRMDQVDYLLYNLKNNPTSRRMVVQLLNPAHIKHTKLPPCVMTYLFDVSDGRLNMTVIQRSGDMLAAAGPGGWDEISAAVLQLTLADCCGYKPGIMVHLVNNLHIYDRHMPLVKDIVRRGGKRCEPKVRIEGKHESFYDYKPEDYILEDYEADAMDGVMEVAV